VLATVAVECANEVAVLVPAGVSVGMCADPVVHAYAYAYTYAYTYALRLYAFAIFRLKATVTPATGFAQIETRRVGMTCCPCSTTTLAPSPSAVLRNLRRHVGPGRTCGRRKSTRAALTAGVEAACHALSANRTEDEESLEKQRRECEEEVERVRTRQMRRRVNGQATRDAAPDCYSRAAASGERGTGRRCMPRAGSCAGVNAGGNAGGHACSSAGQSGEDASGARTCEKRASECHALTGHAGVRECFPLTPLLNAQAI
jgi:hypothetical protein